MTRCYDTTYSTFVTETLPPRVFKDREERGGRPANAPIQVAMIALMSMFSALTVLAVSSLQVARAANSFAGSNLYYAAGLYDDDRTTLLE